MPSNTLQQYLDKAAARQKRWRESQKAKGLRRVCLWLDPETERILHNATTGHVEGKQAAVTALVTRLLQEYHHATHYATPSQAEVVLELPEALFGRDREARKVALLELANAMEQQGGTLTALAERLNKAGVPMLKGTGRWNTKNLFQAVARIRQEVESV